MGNKVDISTNKKGRLLSIIPPDVESGPVECPSIDLVLINGLTAELMNGPVPQVSVNVAGFINTLSGGTLPYIYYGISKDGGQTWNVADNPNEAYVTFYCDEIGVNEIQITVGDSCITTFSTDFASTYILIQDPGLC